MKFLMTVGLALTLTAVAWADDEDFSFLHFRAKAQSKVKSDACAANASRAAAEALIGVAMDAGVDLPEEIWIEAVHGTGPLYIVELPADYLAVKHIVVKTEKKANGQCVALSADPIIMMGRE